MKALLQSSLHRRASVIGLQAPRNHCTIAHITVLFSGTDGSSDGLYGENQVRQIVSSPIWPIEYFFDAQHTIIQKCIFLPPEQPAKVIPHGILWPFMLLTGCFALWGFANDVTNPMVKAFSKIMLISNFARSCLNTSTREDC
jgi:hypothetical protein